MPFLLNSQDVAWNLPFGQPLLDIWSAVANMFDVSFVCWLEVLWFYTPQVQDLRFQATVWYP